MTFARTFNNNFAVRSMGTPGQWAAAAAYCESTWINMQGYRRAIFIGHAGELDADMTVAVYEATSSAGANASAVAALTGTFTNGTDEGLPGVIEIRDADLTEDYNYINIRVTPGAADGFSGIILLADPISAPVTNTVATHVAFVDET
jgi:hypothetical protein